MDVGRGLQDLLDESDGLDFGQILVISDEREEFLSANQLQDEVEVSLMEELSVKFHYIFVLQSGMDFPFSLQSDALFLPTSLVVDFLHRKRLSTRHMNGLVYSRNVTVS